MSIALAARTLSRFICNQPKSNYQRLKFTSRYLQGTTMADNNEEEQGDAGQFILKPPKGMRDIEPKRAWQRKRIFQIITDCFERHGAQPLDTPVCERREILAGKYGEESKLIYNLEDQGGEALSLRYDLTVPFARFLGQRKIRTMTRYHIAKVYRRDNPSFAKGRYREFYQCDIDFAGEYGVMMADSECLQILCEILTSIKLPYDFSIKINHRCILNGMFQATGVPVDKFKPICSSIDKLDKLSWAEVKKEMCTEKGLDEEVADRIGSYVSRSGDVTLIDELLQSDLGQNVEAQNGLKELKLLYKIAEGMGIAKHLKFDLSLARGLDYYTGLIFETIVLGDVEVGSIAAGGRYDNLVSNLLDNPNFTVPCVGLSVGIERLFAILESQANSDQLAESQVHCCIGSIGKDIWVHRYRIASELRKNGLRVKVYLKGDSVQPRNFYESCEKESIPYAIFFGAREVQDNMVSLKKVLRGPEEEKTSDEKISIDELADQLKKRLGITGSQESTDQ